jgi:hypothetical protein
MAVADLQGISPAYWVGGGALLLWMSFLAPWAFGERARWNDDWAKKLQQAQMNYHDAIHARAHSGQSSKEVEQAFEQARGEFQELQGRLTATRSGGSWVAAAMRILGFVLLIVGGARIYRDRIAG